MTIRIEGANYAVTNVLREIEHILENKAIEYNLICAGGHYSHSNSCIQVIISGSPLSIVDKLEYKNVCIEVVEETPGAIFTYLSEKGSTKFTIDCQDTEIDYDYDDFEDEELYCERMKEIGVLL